MPLLTRPRALRPGDTVAAVSPSWGGPAVFPARYEAGKRAFAEIFGVRVVEMPHTLAAPDLLEKHPEKRAADLMQAFADPAISGIVATIGGDDSIRLLPHLDLDVIRQNPKIVLGFSDTTTLHLACWAAGLGSFYGPSLMAGFAERGGMHAYSVAAVKKALAVPAPIGRIARNEEGWVAGGDDWSDPKLQSLARPLQPVGLPKILQGAGTVSGHLLGGCAEVLEMVKGTAWWPGLSVWDGAILFYETSEEAPEPRYLRYWLRNLAAQGILHRLNGVLLARPDPGGRDTYQGDLEAVVMACLAEAGLADLPLLSRLDFGHTQPMLTLPYGARAEIDCDRATLTILDPGVC